VNTLNRIIMVLLILVVFFVVNVGLVVPNESLRIVYNTADNALKTMDRIRPGFIVPFRALLVLCALLLDILLFALLVLEVRGPAKRTIRIKRVGGGEVIVTSESIAERLQYHIDQVADVVSVKALVKPRGGGVDLDLQIQTGADVNVPEKAEQILQVAKQVVEDKLGLVLSGKPRVNIHVTPTPTLAARPTSLAPGRPPSDQGRPGI
jgi:uncharacterized alkaline shock family protein YloU